MVSDDRLMQLFSEFVGWQNYAATEFAMAEVNEEQAQANLRRVEAEAMVTLDPKPGKITVAKAEAKMSPIIEAAHNEWLKAYATRKMTGVMAENCERCAALVSRELSRRIGRDGIERRAMRWNP